MEADIGIWNMKIESDKRKRRQSLATDGTRIKHGCKKDGWI
jgi:hypothetical protein